MAVRSYIKSSVSGQTYFIGDYYTQRAKLDEAIADLKHIPCCMLVFEIADYKLELENDADKAAQRLGLIHTWDCDGCPIRCKYCALNFPGQDPWR